MKNNVPGTVKASNTPGHGSFEYCDAIRQKAVSCTTLFWIP